MTQAPSAFRLDGRFRLGALAALHLALAGSPATTALAGESPATVTPITHVIVLIGENRTFDHLFATYRPKGRDSVKNLLSEGIVNADGTPGRYFYKAAQFRATAPFRKQYFISLGKREKAPYDRLPPPTLNHSPGPASGKPPPFPPETAPATLAALEPSLETADLRLLTTGAPGATQTTVLPDFDARVMHYDRLPNGPFPLAGPGLPYDSYTGDSTHRLFEMWQQSDCSLAHATRGNPSGCLSDLYPFVIASYASEPDPDSTPAPGRVLDNGGGNSLSFYNMQQGDVPILRQLADEYSMSDNYHQAVMGGTGANHMMLGTGDALYWSDGHGHATTPPSHIANPNPRPGSNNQYAVDHDFDGNFAACADPRQPGVEPIRRYLRSLPYHPRANCEPGHFYMINNHNPAFLPDGSVDTAGLARGTALPPSNVRTIGEALNDRGVSWAYYGGAYNAAVALTRLEAQGKTTTDPAILVGKSYCINCDFETYTSAIMGDAAQRAAHLRDAADFYAAVDAGTLPAVSFLKPDELLDGHPASSKVDLFEAMVNKTMHHLSANPRLFASTVLFITMDEGGGYYDSGYIQPLDFFGDGPRIPLIAVSPFSRGGHVSHTYADHVSILKFIERNWGLKPLTDRSRDNLPNPRAGRGNPYVPVNSPALGDLFDLFDFGREVGRH